MNSALLNSGRNVTCMWVFCIEMIAGNAGGITRHRKSNVGGGSAAKPWDPKEKSGLPAEFTGKKTVQISGLGAGSRRKKDLNSSLAHDKYLADPQHGELHM